MRVAGLLSAARSPARGWAPGTLAPGGASTGMVSTSASGMTGATISGARGWAGATLVFGSIGAHNPPGLSQGVLQALSMASALTANKPFRLLISITTPK
jgi:hypothetical protein